MSQESDQKTQENIQATRTRDKMLKLMYPVIREKMNNNEKKANSALFPAGTVKRLAHNVSKTIPEEDSR